MVQCARIQVSDPERQCSLDLISWDAKYGDFAVNNLENGSFRNRENLQYLKTADSFH